MNCLLTTAVIPCLNEVESLPLTCASLGFAPDQNPPADTMLVLVDNGSEDGTREFAEFLRTSVPEGSVLVAFEPERGYVPPRARGNEVAAAAAALRGVPAEGLLVAQADADTLYSEGYLEALRDCSDTAGPGVIVDACMAWPPAFQALHEAFLQRFDVVDAEFAPWLMDHPDDVIVDDKACAYRHSDYLLWGGHLREWNSGGEEIHAETTRLYIRGRNVGARRQLCGAATAIHSPRRLVAEPSLFTATAGFPREPSFRADWHSAYGGPDSLESIATATDADIAPIIAARRAHLWGLFTLLPAYVEQTQGRSRVRVHETETQTALRVLEHRGIDPCDTASGAILADVLRLVTSRFTDALRTFLFRGSIIALVCASSHAADVTALAVHQRHATRPQFPTER